SRRARRPFNRPFPLPASRARYTTGGGPSEGNPEERRRRVREYELMLVLDPTLDEDGSKAATERVEGFVTGRGGEMLSVDPLGRRRMAYAINRHRDAIYTIARFQIVPTAAEELDRPLKVNGQALRPLP